MDPSPSSATAEIDRYIEEGRRLMARAEAGYRALAEQGAPEGHLLMAGRTITAMNRVQATLLRQRATLQQAVEAAQAPAVILVARPPRPWWALVGRLRSEARPS
ncbi:hypothetical protein [Methylobacterium radiodurans]|uniref:Uncharacterized protein n=1 Tax=Methylobacterium radiodurans TaxID=2202828 RepID=A0A2U8VRC7_9HYPH|nr:hypothetical protein [Methylobacterium radiodurans]AWN36028.1 hypothetical protein DK427_10065 [Methylobacterium radiodurans]